MTLSIEIPADVESTLCRHFGAKLESCAKQELAATWFSEGKISSRQVASLLGLSLFEAHAFLKAKGAAMPMTLAEVEADLAALRESRGL